MSSSYVRTQIKDFLTAEAPTEKQADMSGGYEDISQFLSDKGITMLEPWIGLQFIPGDEQPITIPAQNDQGVYRETGAIFIHLVDVAKPDVNDSILARGEILRNLFRGRRIGEVKIESVTPLNFELGATLDFDGGGFVAATMILSYENDLNL